MQDKSELQEMVQETVDTNSRDITSAVTPTEIKQTSIIKSLHSHRSSLTSLEYKASRQVIIFILHQKAGIQTLLQSTFHFLGSNYIFLTKKRYAFYTLLLV